MGCELTHSLDAESVAIVLENSMKLEILKPTELVTLTMGVRGNLFENKEVPVKEALIKLNEYNCQKYPQDVWVEVYFQEMEVYPLSFSSEEDYVFLAVRS